jgi:hypothetical protein
MTQGEWRGQALRLGNSLRRLRPRGVVTLLLLAGVLVLALGPLVGPFVGPSSAAAAAPQEQAAAAVATGRTPPTKAAQKRRPDVSLAPPAPVAGPVLPAEVLAHLPVTPDVLVPPAALASDRDEDRVAGAMAPLYEILPSPATAVGVASPVRVEYTFDPRLERRVFEILDSRGVRLANVVVMDPQTGRLLAYASSDTERFPPNRTYPAASLIKVVTAAAALHHDRERAEQPCRFLGSPYTLTPARINPPRLGQTVTLERALATSNNQCFAQLAVHAIGTDAMVDAIKRFGFLRSPAPGHAAGTIDAGSDSYDLGRLGCGLTGCWITPLHAVQLGASLANGRVVEPWWIERATDAQGRELTLPPRRATRQVLTPALANELRSMLIETTEAGTARRGFHDGTGRPLLGDIRVAGKTGSLSGTDPAGRYEWFTGVAPAENPTVAIAVVVVQQQRLWVHASYIAGEVLHAYFCESGAGCPGGGTIRSTAELERAQRKHVKPKRPVHRTKRGVRSRVS